MGSKGDNRALDHKCPACRAPIEFKVKLGKWKCDYCDNEYALEDLQKYNNASSEANNESTTEEMVDDYDEYMGPEHPQPDAVVEETVTVEEVPEPEGLEDEAEAEKERRIKEAEGEAEAILKVQQANADGIRFLKEAGADQAVLTIKSLEAFEHAADGKATKIIIPSELQGIAGLAKSVVEVAKED